MKQSDRLLPVANVAGIMKKTIPKKAKISRDAKEMMQRAASEFIAFITCKAQDLCKLEKRKTLTGDDLVLAVEHLGMPLHADAGRRVLYRLREGHQHDQDIYIQDSGASIHWKPYQQE
ncbi:nuclear transcription Y subunit beta [Nematocida parisii]|uniref:Ccaat binding transcription factor subunit A n=1 Tax=Nematocida parisii (strain ERTm3) TaxID=935791 RepID=I3EFY1_NEMP3|nr:ccaat binding transcription factor subunit A [Nematocida parisii ERTm1]EIJ88128.1 ccaat binding transcription factor subunit A [Nematocida parisii ERTm3]KAI5130790.1 nuclear transcription Y subunit beta [Nematocida parisii]EIJ93805.1 ccaat binding transcription factor subunit A [Nematocida parisii ERTm1]KAI5130919.1 nuclear transcription Y subunit beta [Nematocida parisii]KAI5144905.1 nuclear transcription Y subunit beta [Nematocida parisii]|eukprot:XP_013059205.1 ccaat binding transcription factor subunit A [Nematocida parisii ERTm1]